MKTLTSAAYLFSAALLAGCGDRKPPAAPAAPVAVVDPCAIEANLLARSKFLAGASPQDAVDILEPCRGTLSPDGLSFLTQVTAEAEVRKAKVLPTVSVVVADSSSLSSWSYSEDVDQMTSKVKTFARLTSTNQIKLDFPYSGNNWGYLTVRRHPQHGLDVLVSISKGQILCASYSGCTVKVRFGDGQPMNFKAAPSDDHSSDIVFLMDARGFIERAKKVRDIKVQLNIYNHGSEVLEFTATDPLVWGQSAKPKVK